MSFTEKVKNEITDIKLTKSEEIAELSSFIRTNGKFFDEYVEIYTENIKVAKRIFCLVKNIYNVDSEIITKKSQIFDKKNVYFVKLAEKKSFILEDLSVL